MLNKLQKFLKLLILKKVFPLIHHKLINKLTQITSFLILESVLRLNYLAEKISKIPTLWLLSLAPDKLNTVPILLVLRIVFYNWKIV